MEQNTRNNEEKLLSIDIDNLDYEIAAILLSMNYAISRINKSFDFIEQQLSTITASCGNLKN